MDSLAFLEHLGCGVLVFDSDLKVEQINRRAGELFGVSSPNLLDYPLDEVDSFFLGPRGEPLPPSERPLRKTVDRRERLSAMELILQRSDGSRSRISLNVTPLCDKDGNLQGVLADFDPRCPSEERLEWFIGAMDEIVFELDAEGRYLNAWTDNEALLRLPRAELLGKRLDEVIPEELAEKIHAGFRRIRVSGEPETLEYAMEVPGGERWFLARMALVPSPEGREPTFSFLARDITAQKELEHSLRVSEGRFRSLFENAAAGIALVGMNGCCLEANRSLQKLLGYSEEELRRRSFETYSHPEDLAADMERFRRLMRGEIDSYSLEKRFYRKEGGIVWGLMTVALQSDERGAPLYSIAILEDITRRKEVEAEKDQLIKELEAIFASAAEGIILYDAKGSILRMNAAAEELTGYSEEDRSLSMAERLGRWAPLNAAGQPIDLAESALYRVFLGETVKGEVLQYRWRKEKPNWISFSASPIFDASGRQTGAVGTLTDITRLRDLQLKMENYLHMLAHDMRSPLTIISGHAQLLRDSMRRSELVDASHLSAQSILRATEQIQHMVEDLVDVGRLESGQIALHHDLIDLGQFVDQYLARQQVSEDYRRVRVDIPEGLPPAQVGLHHLERFVGNLISNALKYSAPDRPVEVTASTTEDHVCLTVRDEGEGIAAEEMPHIFNRFYRSPRITRRAGGTGMGLYITKNILEAYGGHIRVQSEPGKGSRFILCLPKAQAASRRGESEPQQGRYRGTLSLN